MQHQFTQGESGPTKPASTPSNMQTPPGQQPTDQRPAWLPEKFKNAEELAVAYSHLEAKLGAPKGDTPVSPPPQGAVETKATPELKPPAVPGSEPAKKPDDVKPEDKIAADLAAKGVDIDGMSKRFWDTGDIAPEDRTTLSTELKKVFGDKGDYVLDQFVAGQKAQLAAYEASVYGPLGGKENASTVLEWARKGGVDADTITVINTLWTSDDVSKHAVASKMLGDKYAAAVGKAPKVTLEGGNVPAVGGEFYSTDDEMLSDMKDPRYKSDAAYRSRVEQKVRNTQARKK